MRTTQNRDVSESADPSVTLLERRPCLQGPLGVNVQSARPIGVSTCEPAPEGRCGAQRVLPLVFPPVPLSAPSLVTASLVAAR